MQRRVQQLILVVAAATVLVGILASPAEAATATTGSATNITSSSAKLNGVVGTGGVQTRWAFQYGTSKNYTTATVTQTIPAGRGNVSVSSTIKNLKANTTYHYRLVAVTTGPAPYYYIVSTNGNDRTFKTSKVPVGKLQLTSTKLNVSRKSKKVGVPLKCANTTLTCKGKLTITKRIRFHRKGKVRFRTITCASGSFSIRGGRSATPRYAVSSTCRGLLAVARKHTISATLTARPSTGQKKISQTVSLTRVR